MEPGGATWASFLELMNLTNSPATEFNTTTLKFLYDALLISQGVYGEEEDRPSAEKTDRQKREKEQTKQNK